MNLWLALALLPVLGPTEVPSGLVPSGLVPAGLVPAGLVHAGLVHAGLVHAGAPVSTSVPAEDDPQVVPTPKAFDEPGALDDAAPGAAESEPRDPDDRTGTWEAGLRVTANGERSGKVEGLVALTPSFALYLIDEVQFRCELPVYYAEENPSSVGVGGNFGFRGYALRNRQIGLFGEVHGGVLWTSERFPDEGTYFNFTYHFGAGASIRLARDIDLEIGARFQHVSNFFIEGRDRNPASNMYGGFVGFSVPY